MQKQTQGNSQETFAEKANEICDVYRNSLYFNDEGEYTVPVDEMTGIQALEHKYPDIPLTQ